MAGKANFHILLAEDNPWDAELVQKALKEHGVMCMLHHVRDGVEAIELISGLDSDPSGPQLDLCLVDRHLPKRGGEDILKHLRSTERFAQTPVIIMSGIKGQYGDDAGAAVAFFEKPSTLDEYMRLGVVVRDILRKGRESD